MIIYNTAGTGSPIWLQQLHMFLEVVQLPVWNTNHQELQGASLQKTPIMLCDHYT